MFSEKRSSMMHGVLLMTLFSCAAFYIGETAVIKSISLSPMIVGIILGMIYANSLRNNLPDTWVPGIQFCSKRVLRVGIILYGFKLTFQDVTAVGSSICGAAAILGAESAIKVKPYKTAVAVSTVVIFGTLSMFLYPILYHNGIFALTPQEMGIFTGSTIHEVAHVVGAGNGMGKEVADFGIIVKMIRVMMLVPVLLIISWYVARSETKYGNNEITKGRKINVPWFAILFLVVIGFNSFNLLPKNFVEFINNFDTFLLTIAMTSLGAETSIDKFRKAGLKPFVLASVLYIWLLGGGYLMAKFLVPVLM